MRRYIIPLLSLVAVLAFVPGNICAQNRAASTSHLSKEQNPATMAPKLTKLSVPSTEVRSLATKLSLRYQDLGSVKISPDVRNAQILVLAPEETQRKIAADVKTMLAASQVGSVQPTSAVGPGPLQTRLANITWREFEDELRQVTGGEIPVTTSRNGERASFHLTAAPLQNTTVEVDRRNNFVTVVAPEPSLVGWQRLIGAIDQKPTIAGETTAWMRVENAEPAPIQRALRLLRELESDPHAVAAPVGPTSPFRNAVFQQNAAPQNDAGTPPVEAATDPLEGGSGVIGDTQIQFVPELGTIIIRGAKRDVERVMDVIKQIEAKAELTQPEVEIVQLQHADSNAVATLLQQLYEDVLSARQGEVSITSLDAPNALLLIGRQEAIDGLKELINKIDQPVDSTSGLRVFRLQHTSAIDAETAIRDFFTDRPGSGDDVRPGLGPRVRVLADYRTNSLVISAAPRDMAEVTRLINELDVEQISTQSEIKVFTLNNAVAEDLAPVLQEAISGTLDDGGDGNVTQPSTSLQIVKLDSEGNQVLNSGILSNAIVTADAGANALVVRAPATSMPLIAELIRQLDKSPGVDSLVKVFTIENGDAAQLTQALVDLFGADAGTTGTSIGAGNLAGLPPSTAGAESSLVPLRFSTDVRTNSIIASGAAEDLEVVESILLRLDSTGFAERITEVIWLRHNNAAEIAVAITDYVTARRTSQTAITQFQQGLGPYDLVDRDIVAIPEIKSNSVLISVSPRLYADVRRMIDQLDRRRPMVLIKTLIAEVALDDTFEIGGEFGLQDSLQYDRGIVNAALPPSTPGFNFNNAGVPNVNSFNPSVLGTTGVSSFGLGTASPTVGYGGFVLNAASDSISLLLRTLQDANRLQILSRPQVMTLDNEPGYLQVGRQIIRVTGVVLNGLNTQVVTEPLDVGLILQVIPRVGADGLIVMEVDATRSDRDPSSGTQIPAGNDVITVDDITITTAQSTVTAFNGQTVVFGGLIQKTRSNSSRRIPYLSNIPILGHFFRFDQEFERRSELLILLTPMIVTGEEDLDYVKQTESGRMSWCLADVVEAHGDVGLSGGYGLWGPAAGNTIYPDLQPTIDHVHGEQVISDQVIEQHTGAIHSVNQPGFIDAAAEQPVGAMPNGYSSDPYAYPSAGTIIDQPYAVPSGSSSSGPSPGLSTEGMLPPNGNQRFTPGNAVQEFSTPSGVELPATNTSGALRNAPQQNLNVIPSPSDASGRANRAPVNQSSYSLPESGIGESAIQADWHELIGGSGEEKKPSVQHASPKNDPPKRIGVAPATALKESRPALLGGSSVAPSPSSTTASTDPTISPRSWIR